MKKCRKRSGWALVDIDSGIINDVVFDGKPQISDGYKKIIKAQKVIVIPVEKKK